MSPNGNATESKVTFGGYEPSLLYPNSSSPIIWLPREIQNSVGGVPNINISFGEKSLQN